MNERIKELAEQAGFQEYFLGSGYIARNTELERFAELVRQDHDARYKQALTDPENQPSQFGTVTIEYMEQQIAAEREACAKLCENGAFLHDQAPDALFGRAVARAIRARGNHEQD